jgi:hypothetical protein
VGPDVQKLAAVVVRGQYDIGPGARRRKHLLDRVEVARRIRLECDDETVGGCELERAAEPAVECPPGSLVLLEPDHLDLERARVGLGDLRRGVLRAVVHEDQPAARPQHRSRFQVGDELREVRFLVEGGDHEQVHQ